MSKLIAGVLTKPFFELAGCAVGFSFSLPDTLTHVAVLRKTIGGLVEALGVSRQDTDDLETIVGELATNVVRHAQGGSYSVTVELSQHSAVVSVTDQGIGFMPEEVAQPGTPRPDNLSHDTLERIGGFGLPMVRSLSEKVDITPNPPPEHGMTIRVTKALQAER